MIERIDGEQGGEGRRRLGGAAESAQDGGGQDAGFVVLAVGVERRFEVREGGRPVGAAGVERRQLVIGSGAPLEVPSGFIEERVGLCRPALPAVGETEIIVRLAGDRIRMP